MEFIHISERELDLLSDGFYEVILNYRNINVICLFNKINHKEFYDYDKNSNNEFINHIMSNHINNKSNYIFLYNIIKNNYEKDVLQKLFDIKPNDFLTYDLVIDENKKTTSTNDTFVNVIGFSFLVVLYNYIFLSFFV